MLSLPEAQSLQQKHMYIESCSLESGGGSGGKRWWEGASNEYVANLKMKKKFVMVIDCENNPFELKCLDGKPLPPFPVTHDISNFQALV